MDMTRPEEPHGDRVMPPPADPWATIDRPVPTVYLGAPDATVADGPSDRTAHLPGPAPAARPDPAAPTGHVPPAAATVHPGPPTPAVYGGDQSTVRQGGATPSVYGGDQATVRREGTAATVYGGDQATVRQGGTAATVYGGDQATVRQAATAATVRRAEPAPTVYGGDQGSTVYGGDQGSTVYGGEPGSTVHPGDTAPTVRAPGEMRFGPGVPVAPVPAPAWPVTAAPRRSRPLWRRLVSMLSALLTLALVALVGFYVWQRLSPLAVESVAVTVPEPAGDTVDVVATVRTNGRGGVIRYQWFRSDASPGAVLTEQVGRGQDVATLTLKWTFSGVGTTTQTATVNITEPSPVQAGTQVAYRCGRG
jgi:hypothetical protein